MRFLSILLSIYFLACSNYQLRGQDSMPESNNTTIANNGMDSIPKLYTPRGPNILDSFRVDSLKQILFAPFEMPIQFNHLGHVKGFEKLPYEDIIKYKKARAKQPWFLVFMLLSLILILILKHFYQKKVFGFIQAIANTTFYREYLDNLEANINMSNVLITLLKTVVFTGLTILVLQYNPHVFGMFGMTWSGMLLIFAILLAYFSFEKIFRHVFSRLTLIDHFNKNVFLIQTAIDLIFIIILLPSLILFYYSTSNSLNTNQLQSAMILILSLYFISRTIIALFLNKESLTIHKFLLFTYLCTFEIFPFLIWVKILRI